MGGTRRTVLELPRMNQEEGAEWRQNISGTRGESFFCLKNFRAFLYFKVLKQTANTMKSLLDYNIKM